MAADEALGHRLPRQRRVVLELHAAVARARIEPPRLVVRVGQLDDRMVHADARGFGCRRDAADAFEKRAASATAAATATSAARSTARRASVAHERQLRFHLGVLGKSERHRRVDGAARGVESIRAGSQPRGHVVAVAHEILGEVDEQPVAGGGGDREAPQDRSRERVTHGARFGGARRQGAELIVRLHHQHLRPGAFELDDARAGQDAAVEPDVVRTEARGESRGVEHLGVEPGNLEPQAAGGFVPVEWEEAVDLLHAGSSVRLST